MKLSNYLVDQILLESNSTQIKKEICVFAGRFQPFHYGHYKKYLMLTKKFGKNNVYIGTSNVVSLPKSPFSFKEKKEIITTMFNIPADKIVEIKNPYNPIEILSKFDKETTSYIAAVGEKDVSRLGGKYFKKYNNDVALNYTDAGYTYIIPSVSNDLSGTAVRHNLSNGTSETKKHYFKNTAYPKYNKKIFNLINNKLNESIKVSKSTIETWLLNESYSNITSDDGPGVFYPTFNAYKHVSLKRATEIGYTLINMLMNNNLEDITPYPDYPNGPVKAVSFYPAGVIGGRTPNNQIDIYSANAYSKWFTHVTRSASLIGYSIVNTQLEKSNRNLDKRFAGAMALADKELQAEFDKAILELITLPVEIGDTLLMGKFKNKKVVVKTIGKDDHGMPTINGKKIVTFRYGKKAPNIFEKLVEFENDVILEDESDKYNHIGFGKYKLKGKENDKSALIYTKDKNGRFITTSKKKNAGQKQKANNVKGADMFNHAPDIKQNKPIKPIIPDKYENIKNKIKNWSDKEKQFFKKEEYDIESKVRREYRKLIKDKLKGAVKSIKKGFKHEIEEFKTAGIAAKKLASGQKLKDSEKSALKGVGITIVTTALFGGVTGGLEHGLLTFGQHVAAELIPHVVGETILKGIGKAALFADIDSSESDLEKFTTAVADNMAKIEITPEMMSNFVDSYNAKKTKNENILLEAASHKLKLNIPANVKKIDKAFKKYGKKIYIVGGAVRDAILGKTPHDFDLTTDAKPHEMIDICEKEGLHHVDTDIIYGMVVIEGDEVVTFRKDVGKNRKLDGIDYTDIEGDVKRRDLTINALFYDIDRKQIVDLVGGIKDLKNKNIRTVGHPDDRFAEDHLRKLRAIRFTAKLGATMDKATLTAIIKDSTLKDVSSDRIRMEFMKSIESAKSTKAYLGIMDKVGFLKLTFPSLNITKPFINESDYIIMMAYLLQNNSKATLESALNKLKYTSLEIKNITFLQSLIIFNPADIVLYKKAQKVSSVTSTQIKKFGKLIKKDFTKFIKFTPTIRGNNVPKNIKGKEIGKWIADEEAKRYLNESKYIPTITFLIGPPASGKSTWVAKNKNNAIVISRDDLVDKFRKPLKLSYGDSFANTELQNKVNIALQSHINTTLKSGKDIIVDMTNMSKKARNRILARVPKIYTKNAVVFNVSKSELKKRLEKREIETGKKVGMDVVNSMLQRFERPDKSEFDNITNEDITEMSFGALKSVEKYADSQLSPEDVEFTNHFFQRVNDDRNGKEITPEELKGFFKRLGKNRKQLLLFLKKYKEFTVTDKKTNINIPLVQKANELIAKTIMRKKKWLSYEPVLKFESINEDITINQYKNALIDLQAAFSKGIKGLTSSDVIKLYYTNAIKLGIKHKLINNATRLAINRYNKRNFTLGGPDIKTAAIGGLDLILSKLDINELNEDLFSSNLKLKPYESSIISAVIAFMKAKFGFNAKIIVKKKNSNILFGDVVLNDNSLNKNKFYLHINPNQSVTMMIQSLIHELTHVKQISKKELKPSDDYKEILWKGKSVIKVSDYKKIMKSFSDYKKLPWEAEAYGNMKPLYSEFLKSKFWHDLKGKNATLDFAIKNISEMKIPLNKKISNFKSLFSKLPTDLQKRIFALKHIKQNEKWHPEGNVLKHTIVVVNQAFKHAPGDIDLALAAIFHDIGKDETASINPRTGKPSHFGHENVSAKLVKQYSSTIKSLGGNPDDVYWIVSQHMRMHKFDVMRLSKQRALQDHPKFDKLKKFATKMDIKGYHESIDELVNDIDGNLENLILPNVKLKKKNYGIQEDLNALTLYQTKVRDLTNENYKTYFSEITDAKKRSREFHIDHKYSIKDGFDNNIPPEVIAHYKNFEIVHHSVNESKGVSSNILLSELITNIKNSKNPLENRVLLQCGGAYGHLAHPFETDINLTFGQLKDIVNKALDGELETTLEKCISGDTVITTENNGNVTIADFVDNNINDKVLSYNADTNESEFMEVTGKFNNDVDDDWLEIELEDGKTIQVTPNHRIFVNGQYIEARYLVEGMDLKINSSTESNMKIKAIKKIKKSQVRYDIKINNYSCYYANGILIHNTDGQAISVSWKNGKLIAARNKGHLKNKGENALDIKGVAQKFQNRGGLTDAYNFAMQDLSKAISTLSEKQRTKIFDNGGSFMNIEVMWPESVNVIPYNNPLLVFHSTMQYDLDGNIIGQDTNASKILAGMIKQIDQNTQKHYKLQGPPVTILPKNETLSSKKSKYISAIAKLQSEFGLKNSDGVAAYHQAWWTDYINANSPAKLPQSVLKGLINRWAFFDKSFRLDKNNITDESALLWAKKVDKIDQKKISKNNLMKFEDIFLGVGVDILSFMTSVLTVNPDKALQSMKTRLKKTISDIRKSGTPGQLEKLKLELRRIDAIGGFDKLVPSEGVVFTYNGHIMKLTGLFAPSNQLLGIFYKG